MNHPEHTLQVQCVKWFEAQYPFLTPVFYAVPNGGHRSPTTAATMKAEGQKRGISDLCLDIAATYSKIESEADTEVLRTKTSHGLRIEMKDVKNGRQSDYQKLYEAYCAISGYKYVVCRSLDEFKQVINDWISHVDYYTMVDMKNLYKVSEEARISLEKAKIERKMKRASSGRTAGSRRASSATDAARAEMQGILGHAMRTISRVSDPTLKQLLNAQ